MSFRDQNAPPSITRRKTRAQIPAFCLDVEPIEVCLVHESTPRSTAGGYVHLRDDRFVARARLSNLHHHSTMPL